MGSTDVHAEIDVQERRLLIDSGEGVAVYEEEPILYNASFVEMEEGYVRYHTAKWVIYSLLLVLAWGVGLLMLVYVPVRRYVLRRDFRSRRLYLTPNAIVYKVTRPVPIPWFGVLEKEKNILLPSVADVAVEQGYLQSVFGIYSIRIENIGVRRPSNDDVHILGLANPRAFRKAVLTRIYSLKGKNLGQVGSTEEDMVASSSSHPSGALGPLNSGDIILKKLEEVEGSVKRVQNLLQKMPPPTSSYSIA